MGDWRQIRRSSACAFPPDCALLEAPGFGATSLEGLDAAPGESGLGTRGGSGSGARSRPGFDCPDALARIVEGEILPRLMLAHRAALERDPPAPTRLPVLRRPSSEEIARFAELLLVPAPADGREDVRPQVRALLADGLPLGTLLVDLLAPAARHLGALWEEDECDFLAVTQGLGRIQIIARMLCAELEVSGPCSGRSVLLLPGPGETHLFGLSVVASFFREAGWDVAAPGMILGPEAVAETWFDVVGLSLACDVHLSELATLITSLRQVSYNPGLRVLVGGACFARRPELAERVGADACVLDGRAAPEIAEGLLEMRARAC